MFVGYIGFIFSKLIRAQSSLWIQDLWPEAIETTIGLKNKILRKFILYLQNKMFLFCDILFCESSLYRIIYIRNLIKKSLLCITLLGKNKFIFKML